MRPGAEPPADPTPAEVPQTTAARTTTAAAVMEDLQAHGFKVRRLGESEAFGAKESVDIRINGVEAGVLTFAAPEVAHEWGGDLRELRWDCRGRGHMGRQPG